MYPTYSFLRAFADKLVLSRVFGLFLWVENVVKHALEGRMIYLDRILSVFCDSIFLGQADTATL